MLNWRKYPFVRLLLPFMAGILCYLHCYQDFQYINLLLCFVFLLFLFQHKRLFRAYNLRAVNGCLISLLLFLLGYFLAFHKNDLRRVGHFKEELEQENTYTAYIYELPTVGRTAKLELRVQAVLKGNTWHSTHGKLLAYAELDSLTQQLTYGDQVTIRSPIQLIPAPSNPKAFDAKQYYAYQNIHYQTYIPSGQIAKEEQPHGWLLWRKAYQTRLQCIAILEKHLSGHGLEVGKALILGYKADLSDEVKTAYASTGAMHVLAVSGLHVGIVVLLLNFLLWPFTIDTRRTKVTVAICKIFAILGFVFITGASVSVIRAALMFWLWIIGKEIFQLTTNIYNILVTSAFVLLVINPYTIMSVGFQLSYLAVFSIFYFQKSIEKQFYSEHKVLNKMWTLASVAIAAQIGTMPISIYYFHQFPFYFLLAGLVVVPVAGIVLGLGLLLFGLESCLPSLANYVGMLLHHVLECVNLFIFKLQTLPYALLEGIWWSFSIVVLLYLSFFFFSYFIKTQQHRWLNWGLASVGLAFLLHTSQWVDLYNNKTLVVYDVSRKSLVEFYDPENTVTMKSKQLADKQMQFSAENYRSFRGADTSTTFVLEDLISRNNRVDFGEQSLLILEESMPDTSIQADFLLIRKNPTLELPNILLEVKPQLVIFDGSNYPKQVAEWVESCELYGVDYHVTQSEGAFELEF